MTAAQECVLFSPGTCLQCEICHSIGKSCSGPMKTCTGGEDTCGIILHEVLIGKTSSMCASVAFRVRLAGELVSLPTSVTGSMVHPWIICSFSFY